MSAQAGFINSLLTSTFQCWPNLNVSKRNLLKPDPEFVLHFFGTFVNAYEKVMAAHLHRTVFMDLGPRSMPPVVAIYRKLDYIFRTHRLPIEAPTMSDFRVPQPKRLQELMHTTLHFYAWLQQLIPEVQAVVRVVHDDVECHEQLYTNKQEELEMVDANAETIYKLDQRMESLQAQHNNLQFKIAEMEETEKATEALVHAKRTLLSRLREHHARQQAKSQANSEVEQTLREKIVTEDEFRTLREDLDAAKRTAEELGSLTEEYYETSKLLQCEDEHLNNMQTLLKSLHLDTLKEEDLCKVICDETATKEEFKQRQVKSSQLASIIKDQHRVLADAKRRFLEAENQHTALMLNLRKELESYQNTLSEQKKHTTAQQQECKCIRDAIEKLMERRNLAKKIFAEELQTVDRQIREVWDIYKRCLDRLKINLNY